MRSRCSTCFAAALVFSALSSPIFASTIDFQFDATLQSGPLAGTSFAGTGSYDTTGSTGIGKEWLSLTALDFTLLGVSFTRNDISQGGQAILQDGILFDFTAAFFPPPPAGSPVSDIAFGFGGPGVIGYIAPPSTDIGLGSYTLGAASTPEPAGFALAAVGILGVGVLRLTSRVRRHPVRESSTDA